jgi:hypothetical protein
VGLFVGKNKVKRRKGMRVVDSRGLLVAEALEATTLKRRSAHHIFLIAFFIFNFDPAEFSKDPTEQSITIGEAIGSSYFRRDN